MGLLADIGFIPYCLNPSFFRNPTNIPHASSYQTNLKCIPGHNRCARRIRGRYLLLPAIAGHKPGGRTDNHTVRRARAVSVFAALATVRAFSYHTAIFGARGAYRMTVRVNKEIVLRLTFRTRARFGADNECLTTAPEDHGRRFVWLVRGMG